MLKEVETQRFNEGKTDWTLVHFPSLKPLLSVLAYGANKYSKDNWKNGGVNTEKTVIMQSMLRHVLALAGGEERDKESKLHHIGHIMANCMFYTYHHIIPKRLK